MSAFLSELDLRDIDGETWLLLADLHYVSDLLHGATITVPAGTVTDLASIPRLIWTIAPKTGRFDHAAVVHDWLYTTGAVEKELADAVFREAMLVKGVSRWRAWCMWKAVAWFGGSAWAAHRA